jgi:Cu(I)/Ag(I) efflux system membrane protein CusA/SilA
VQPANEGFVARCIRAALRHSRLIVVATVVLVACCVWAAQRLTIDALPDLSDVQVVVRTTYPGQAPQIVEDQVTFPLTSGLLAVPGATTVRGYSLFGDSFVYVLFADGTDPYWARSRVLEYLDRVEARLPGGVRPQLGPDATGIGWIFEYALVDRTGANDVAALRSLQDWRLRFELESIDGVAEIAAVGGIVREYQVVLDPDKLRVFGVTLAAVRGAIEAGNRETGGSVIELAEAEYAVRASGYVRSVEDLRLIPVKLGDSGVPVLLGDLADVRIGPAMRRGIADLDGEGEVAGGVVVLRHGADARGTLGKVKARLGELEKTLPSGVEVVTTYDRSVLIDRAIDNLAVKLVLEFLVVLAVCVVFLRHARSALVVVAFLPVAIAVALAIMSIQGVSVNIMSLGGIAIAIGAMVDAVIVMVENVHKRLERAGEMPLDPSERLRLIGDACVEVAPALFAALLIVALSFVPVLALESQEGRLFAALAYTKTYAMLAAAIGSIVLAPALIALLVKGRLRSESDNPVSRASAAVYRPLLAFALRRPWWVIAGSVALVLVSAWPFMRLGSEFLPAMDEGDLLYMPTTLPGISAGAAQAALQQTDRLIAEVPEVAHVFGKAGRAETATDPAPYEMFETTVMLKPRSEWRAGVTPETLRAELETRLTLPGFSNSLLSPIRARVDMLSTGARTPLAIRITGADVAEIARIAAQLERLVGALPGVASAYAERVAGGRYIDVDMDRIAAARYGLNVSDVHDVVALAIGGDTVGESVQGRERYPISIRYPQERRDSVENLRTLPVVTPQGSAVPLGDLAQIRIREGPAALRSENAQPAGLVSIVLATGDLEKFVRDAARQIDVAGIVPTGYRLQWTGEYEHLRRAYSRLTLVIPLVVAVIAGLLYLTSRRGADLSLILASVPVALVGGVWLLWVLGYALSIAVVVGFVALTGVAVETGIVMLLFLNSAWARRSAAVGAPTERDLRDAIMEGALLRLRPKLMTAVTIIAALLPIMIGHGTGSELMQRIAAPMVGGMVSATLLTLLVIPAGFLLIHRRELAGGRTVA